jgi:hypothetical protein
MSAKVLILSLILLAPLGAMAQESAPLLTLKREDVKLTSNFPTKKNIVTTTFWIGQGSSGYNSTTNYKSAWDGSWTRNFGGTDCPESRVGRPTPGAITLPKRFAPTLNPYYVALPFNDIKYPKLSRQHIPWWNAEFHKKNPYVSQCKGRWIMIEFNGRVCFAQWEDVGPLRYDHVSYVFGNDAPTREHSRAGLDVSPAVQDYLGLTGRSNTNWRFVEEDEVPYGPWIEYAEQAIVFSVLKAEYKKKIN